MSTPTTIHRYNDPLNNGHPLPFTLAQDVVVERDPIREVLAIVAVGGSGKEVLAAMLSQFGGSLPGGVYAFALDSDPDLCGLPEDLVLTLELPQADNLVAHRQLWPRIDKALPPNYRPGKIKKGAKLKRMLTASILMPFYAPAIRAALRKRIVEPLLALSNSKATGTLQVHIKVVGSLNGGFGSGTIWAVPAFIRHEVGPEVDVTIELHAFTASVHLDVLKLDWMKDRCMANMAAALAEFEISYHHPERVPTELLGIEPFYRPLVDQCMLYDRMNEQHAMLRDARECYRMVATALVSQTWAAVAAPQAGHLANVMGDGSECLSPLANKTAPYGSQVAHRLTFPRREIRQFAALYGLQKLCAAADERKCTPRELEQQASEWFHQCGLATVQDRLFQCATPKQPDILTPANSDEWDQSPGLFRHTRGELENRSLPRFERLTESLIAPESDKTTTECLGLIRGRLATPARVSPAEVMETADMVVDMIDGSIAGFRERSAAIDRQKLVQIVDRAEAQLADEAQTGMKFLRRRRIRRAWFVACKRLKDLASQWQRKAQLDATATILGRVRAAIAQWRQQAAPISKHLTMAKRRIGATASELSANLGGEQTFVTFATDFSWAKNFVSECLSGVDWKAKSDELLGPGIEQFSNLSSAQEVLCGPAYKSIAAMVDLPLSKFNVLSPKLCVSAEQWLAQKFAEAAPQFMYNEALCGQDGQTYFSRVLAVDDLEQAETALRAVLTGKDIEVVETNDPDQIVLIVQRRSVPLAAAIGNLSTLRKSFRNWQEITKTNPQAVVPSCHEFARIDLLSYIPCPGDADA